MKSYYFKTCAVLMLVGAGLLFVQSCKPKTAQSAATGDAAKSFVAPGSTMNFTILYPVDLTARLVSMEYRRVACSALYLSFLKIRKAVMVSARKQSQC